MLSHKTNRTPRLILAALFLIGIGVYLSVPTYLMNALIHGNPDLNDYQFFPNRTVSAGKTMPWKISPQVNTVTLPDTLLMNIEKMQTVAFLVIRDQEIIYEKYWEGYSESSLSNSFSAAKSIVGLLVGIAMDEGYIDSVNQSVGDFLPEYAVGDKKNIRLRDLLTMSSGLNWEEAYTSPYSVTTQAYYGDNLPALLADLEVITPPGKHFNYLSGDTQLLAMVLKRATGKDLSEYASEKLWKKMGAVHDALWSLDHKDGMEKAYCCFNSNARDFARFGQLILNNGSWNGEQVISEDYLREATSPASYLLDDNNKPVDFYGFQWWIIPYKDQSIPYMRGILGQYIFALPEQNAVIVRLGHKRSKQYMGEHTLGTFVYLKAGEYILQNQSQ
jgi:CubicO group peptidase (beta-lactamase class C family)